MGEVPADWAPVEVVEIPLSPQAGELLIDHSDIVIALAKGDGNLVEEMCESSALKALCRPVMLEKPAIVFWSSWLETDWPAVDKVSVLLPEEMMLRLADESVEWIDR